MRIADLPESELRRHLQHQGIWLQVSAFTYRIRSPHPVVADGIALLYAAYPVSVEARFADFHVRIAPPLGLRRWIAAQVRFEFDGEVPFHPFPYAQALPMLEWGMNWCVSAHCRDRLVIHAGVAERNGRALILPAPPGSGKSTLCAALSSRGWRLLSDELALLDFDSGLLDPFARPVNLKNESIDIIRAFAPEAALSEPVADTTKGTIAHMRLPDSQLDRATEPAPPAWIVLPRYVPGAGAVLGPLPKAQAFMKIAEQSFNYGFAGALGFEAVARLVDACDCYEFAFDDLAQAVAALDRLANRESA